MPKNILRKSVIAILGIIFVGGLLVWFLAIKPWAENRINQAFSSYAQVSSDGKNNDLKVFFLGAKHPATFIINSKPIPIPLDKPTIELSPLSILKLAPKISFISNLFGGALDGHLTYKISDSSINADFSGENIKISNYQLASMIGITAGDINFKLEMRNGTNDMLMPSKLSFMLKGLSKPMASKLPKWISPLGITIPAIDRGDIIADAICDHSFCKSTRFTINSNLGQASGSFSIPLNKSEEIKSTITVSLTQAGRNEILPYFSLLNRELLSSPDKPFVIKISGYMDRPKLIVVPIQNSL